MLTGAASLSWYASVMERSPYVIQGLNAVVRELTKLEGEGEPQGATRQAPEPPDPAGQALTQEIR